LFKIPPASSNTKTKSKGRTEERTKNAAKKENTKKMRTEKTQTSLFYKLITLS
jgi:hypothetical protein